MKLQESLTSAKFEVTWRETLLVAASFYFTHMLNLHIFSKEILQKGWDHLVWSHNGEKLYKKADPHLAWSHIGEKPSWLLLDFILHKCHTSPFVLWYNDVSFQSPSLLSHANGPKWRKLWKKPTPTSFEVTWKETLLVATRFYCIHMIYLDPCAMYNDVSFKSPPLLSVKVQWKWAKIQEIAEKADPNLVWSHMERNLIGCY